MCGRFTHRLTWEQVHGLYYLTDPRQPQLDLRPRYNAAPTGLLPVCRLDRQGVREIAMLHWGLIPFWANDPKVGFKSINARAETVATAPAFREAFKHRRCLVPANGFYEWRKLAGGGKQPYLIQMRDGAPFSFAGLWERWKRPGADRVVHDHHRRAQLPGRRPPRPDARDPRSCGLRQLADWQ
jgi:putative SOS response-associated peptidase YedK